MKKILMLIVCSFFCCVLSAQQRNGGTWKKVQKKVQEKGTSTASSDRIPQDVEYFTNYKELVVDDYYDKNYRKTILAFNENNFVLIMRMKSFYNVGEKIYLKYSKGKSSDDNIISLNCRFCGSRDKQDYFAFFAIPKDLVDPQTIYLKPRDECYIYVQKIRYKSSNGGYNDFSGFNLGYDAHDLASKRQSDLKKAQEEAKKRKMMQTDPTYGM